MKEVSKDKKLKIIGNLPYYITTPIISYLIEERRFVDSIFLTVQKEVGKRLTANPGSKDYSPISIYTQFYTKPHLLFLITKRVFYPQPDVDSAFVRFDVPEAPRVEAKDEKVFFKLIKTVFSKRRKTLLNALASSDICDLEKNEMKILLKGINIDPMKRPEDISLQEFANLADSIHR